ncbi:MAG: glutamine--fructose-6-phosphate aminotransferase [Lentisphaerae bacterium GWF2_52_8]|nr:MAG: glutamine--fructose-6-phosphate aminotransferase [Lentisphaerae bacterium GWF2_52_8]
MCGIVGYLGERQTVKTLLDGLRRLEYRGYDSAGLAVLENGALRVFKAKGKVAALAQKLQQEWPESNSSSINTGIAHTRWATHGPPTEANAHPHLDKSGRIALVHNGIIENYSSLKKHLQAKGHEFRSDTDTEVLAQLIGQCYEGELLQATAAALKQVEGTFGIVVMSVDHPGCLVVARRGSPIAIGVGKAETIVASDISAIVSHTKSVIFLNDGDLALLKAESIDIRNIDNVPVSRETAHIDWDTAAAEKGGFEHFMLKEIFEQPEALANAVRGRLDDAQASSTLSGLNLSPREIAQINRVVIAACGTSLHAGMMGEYYFEDLANLPVEIQQAAEFRYRNPIIEPQSLVLAISQSGETADTLAAVREAINKGAIVAGICNVVGSTIARETGRGVYIHAGPEIGVASTKAFTCQVAVLLMMALKFGRGRRLSREAGMQIIKELQALPKLVSQVFESAPEIEKIAVKYAKAQNCFFIGRGYLYPVALEGALKLKEISYIHAEGYHAAELKHGPIALLEESVPVIALANDVPGKDKILGNIQECKARHAPVIATATRGDQEVAALANDVIWLPACTQFVAPIPTVVALQLLSYYVAKARGCAIDQPRNLAKSVTVE